MIGPLTRRAHAFRTPALLLTLVCGGVLILWAGRGTIFFADEWALVTSRLGGNADAYLEPHNEHLVLLQVAVFKALFATVGLGDYWIYRLTVVVVHLICVALLFVIVERRRGPVVAGLAAAPILVLGSSSEVLLWPFDISFAGSMAAGLGAMLALDARRRRGDVAACLLLVVALASSGLGISIALGVLVELLWDRDRRRRLWIVAVPAALYGAWYVAYNLDPARQGPLDYASAPEFAVRVGGAAVAGLLGIPEFETGGTRVGIWAPRLGIGLLLLGGVALVWLVVSRRALTPRLAMLIATLGSYWAFIGVSRAYTDAPMATRYIYAGAILMLLIAVEATRGYAIRRPVLAGLAAVAIVAAALNVHWLEWNGNLFRRDSRLTAAELGALEVARGDVAPDFRPILRPAYPLTAGGYFAAVDRLEGSVATPAGELADRPEFERSATDRVLIRGTVTQLPFTAETRRFLRAAGSDTGERSCSDANDRRMVILPEGGAVIVPGREAVQLRLRRFATGFSPVASVNSPTLLAASLGNSGRRWQAELTAREPFRVC